MRKTGWRYDRIALLGWSNGGIAALWAVRPRLAPNDSKPDFRSAAAFYPGCRRLLNAAWSTRVPTLVLIGSADDQNRPAECQQMVGGRQGPQRTAVIHVYPAPITISTIQAGACRRAAATRSPPMAAGGCTPAPIRRHAPTRLSACRSG
jgi:dienelactone hydrolase